MHIQNGNTHITNNTYIINVINSDNAAVTLPCTPPAPQPAPEPTNLALRLVKALVALAPIAKALAPYAAQLMGG